MTTMTGRLPKDGEYWTLTVLPHAIKNTTNLRQVLEWDLHIQIEDVTIPEDQPTIKLTFPQGTRKGKSVVSQVWDGDVQETVSDLIHYTLPTGEKVYYSYTVFLREGGQESGSLWIKEAEKGE